MPDPTNYVPGYDFSDYQASNPNKPLPADRLDDELHDISDALGGAITALKDIRRSDGNLVNKVVTYDALADDLRGPVYASEVYQRTHLNTLADLRNDLDLSYAILDVGARIQAGNYGFIVAPLAAADWHLKTAGDLLLYADVGSKAQAEQFGLATTNTAADNDAALARAAAWLNGASFRDLVVGQGRFEVSAQMPVITRSQVSFRGAGYEATSFRFPIGTTNGRFIQINTGLSAIARVSVGGFAIEYLATASMSGFAIDIDRASDVLVSDIRLVGAAGAVRVGSTAQCSRVTIDNIVGTFRDAFDHRVGVFTRWTGLQISNFTMYGDGTAQRSVPTFDFTTVGICDTLDMYNIDCWSRAGSPWGIFGNFDNGTFVNAIFTNVIVDKSGNGTQGTRAAVWFEMTSASTSSVINFWKFQNVIFYGLRADTGGDNPGGQGVVIRQGCSTGYSAMRGIHFVDSDITVRDSIGLTASATGTDTIEDISVKGGFWKDAASGTIAAMFQMGVNRFSITGVSAGFAERNQTPSVTNFVDITNAAIDEYVIDGNMVYNVTGDLVKHPTYAALSEYRVIGTNSHVGRGDLAMPMLAPVSLFPPLSTKTANAALNHVALNAYLLEGQSLGRQVKVGPGSIPLTGQINPPTGSAFTWVNDVSTVYVPLYNNANGFVRPLTPTAEITDALIENLTVRPAIDAGTSLPYTGNGFVGILRRSTMIRPRVENYWGDQAFLILPYQSTIHGLYAYTESALGGTGACRMLGGEDSQVYVDYTYSGDDGLQFVPSLTGTYINRDIKNCQYIGGVASSNARPFLAFIDDDMTSDIINCGFVGITGIAREATALNAGSVAITSQGPGVVSGLQITNCSIDEKVRTLSNSAGHGVRLEGNIQNCSINVTITEPCRSVLRLIPTALNSLVPVGNTISVTTDTPQRDGSDPAILIQAGERNVIIPKIYAPGDDHGALVTGGNRNSFRDGHILGVAATWAGVRDASATNTDISRMAFSGTGAPYSFAATPATTGRVLHCDFGGMTVTGSAPVTDTNRA